MRLAAERIPCGSVREVEIVINGIIEMPSESGSIYNPGTVVKVLKVRGIKNCKCCPPDKESGPVIRNPKPGEKLKLFVPQK